MRGQNGMTERASSLSLTVGTGRVVQARRSRDPDYAGGLGGRTGTGSQSQRGRYTSVRRHGDAVGRHRQMGEEKE